MAMPPVLENKPIAGRLGQRRSFGLLSLLQLVRALVAIPLVATGGIGTGAAIAAVLVAPRRQALTPSRMKQAPAPSRTIRQTGPRCRAGLVPEGVLLALRRELDAFREGNYVPIINEHC
jgi:hypothetical protein